MICIFRGPFQAEERRRIESALEALEGPFQSGTPPAPAWLILHAINQISDLYLAIRFRDGRALNAPSVGSLIDALTALKSDNQFE